MSDEEDKKECACPYTTRVYHGRYQHVRKHNLRCPVHGRPNPFKLVSAEEPMCKLVPSLGESKPCCSSCRNDGECDDYNCPCHD